MHAVVATTDTETKAKSKGVFEKSADLRMARTIATGGPSGGNLMDSAAITERCQNLEGSAHLTFDYCRGRIWGHLSLAGALYINTEKR